MPLSFTATRLVYGGAVGVEVGIRFQSVADATDSLLIQRARLWARRKRSALNRSHAFQGVGD